MEILLVKFYLQLFLDDNTRTGSNFFSTRIDSIQDEVWALELNIPGFSLEAYHLSPVWKFGQIAYPLSTKCPHL